MLRLMSMLSAVASVILGMVLLCGVAASAQTSTPSSGNSQVTALEVRTNLVLVPALVKTKSGELVFALTAEDFILTDNGVPQPLRLEPDTDEQPVALAVIVQTGGLGDIPPGRLSQPRCRAGCCRWQCGTSRCGGHLRQQASPCRRLQPRHGCGNPDHRQPARRGIRARQFWTRSISVSIFCASSPQAIAAPCCSSAKPSTMAARPASRRPYAQSMTPTLRFTASAFRAQRWP